MQKFSIPVFLATVLISTAVLTSCDDDKKTTTDHVYAASSQTQTGTVTTTDTPEADTTPEPEAKPEDDGKPVFNDTSVLVYMYPASVPCRIVGYQPDDNFRNVYSLYCDENGANVWHENVPEFLLNPKDGRQP